MLSLKKWKKRKKKLAEEAAANGAENADDDEASGGNTERQVFEALIDKLSSMDVSGLTFEPADFEKDQDLNFHIDFIYVASNLRATNYRMKNATRHKCKMIAGKIIPAIATTTASVTGLAMLELLKILQNKKLEAFKDSSNSLGLNLYLMQEPSPPEKAKDEYDVIEMSEVKCKPPGFTKWDATKIVAPIDTTMEAFLDLFQTQTGLQCDLLFHQAAEMGEVDAKYKAVSGLMLYDRNAFTPTLKDLYASKMNTVSLVDWLTERYQGLLDVKSRAYVELQTSCSDGEGNAYKVPTVLFHFE